MTINREHILAAVNGTNDNDHTMSIEMLLKIPDLLKNPIAVIQSESRPKDSVVAIVEAQINGRQVFAPVTIQTTSEINGVVIDSNHLASAYGKKSSKAMLERAI